LPDKGLYVSGRTIQGTTAVVMQDNLPSVWSCASGLEYTVLELISV